MKRTVSRIAIATLRSATIMATYAEIEQNEQHLLSLPSIKWVAARDQAPKEMRRSADAVTDGSKVYLRLSHDKEVLVFNLVRKTWDESIFCEYFRSSLVIIDSKLIAVGGTSNMGDDTDCRDELILMQISSTRAPSCNKIIWNQMNKGRCRCTSITCRKSKLLIIVGGENPVGTILTTVEVLNVESNSWYSVECNLPEERYSCSAAIVKNHLYLLGGWKERQLATHKVLKCSIDKLKERCSSSATANCDENIWETLPTLLPVAQSTCVSFRSKLLTFGGTWCGCYECKCSTPTRDIYTYDEDNEKFECIGSTPIAQYLCFACVIEGNKIFIAGGAENEKESLKDVYIYTY